MLLLKKKKNFRRRTTSKIYRFHYNYSILVYMHWEIQA